MLAPLRLCFSVSLALVLLTGATAQTPSAPTSDVAAHSLLETVARAPALAAAHQRVIAARIRSESAGRLRDPEVEAMASRGNMPDETRDMWELTVRQPLPKRGERAADRERARAAVAMAEADYALMAGEIAADVAMALAEVAGAAARIHALDTQLARMDAVLKSIEARLAAGATGRIADRLTVQTRIAAMQLMLERERRMADDALADARALLGLSPEQPLPAFAAPRAAEIAVDEAAALRLASARAAEADAMETMARASANPMTAVGLRFERERSRMGNGDTIGLAFMSEIPWRSRRYARADARAADAERTAARAEGAAARYRIAGTLSRAERAERLAATAERLGRETRARLDAEYDALIRSAGTGAGPMGGESSVLQAVEILEKATDTELQVIEAETAARVARAELWRFVPTSQFIPFQP